MRELSELIHKNLALKGDTLEQLQSAVSALLDEQFILRSRDAGYETYEFIRRNEGLISDILEACGLELMHYRDYLFYYVVSRLNRNRVSLSQSETIVLLILRLLYEEAMHDLKVSNGIASVTNRDIQEKYRAFINAERPMEKTHLRNSITALKRLAVLEYEGAFSSDADFRMMLLPTIMIVVDRTTVEGLQTRLRDYAKTGEQDG